MKVLLAIHAVFLTCLISHVTGKSCEGAACQFKAPNSSTPADVSNAWRKADETLWNYVAEQVPAVLEHTGEAAFDEHLKGVQAVLRYWEAPEHVTHAGLFHSIYGTEGFQGFSLPLSERPAIQKLIGKKAEYLAFVFCMVDRSTLDETVFAWSETNRPPTKHIFHLKARPELGRFPITLTREEWLDFIELTLADWLEQVEGAAKKPNPTYHWEIGQAYAYRRTAYAKMSRILAVERAPRLTNVAPQMLKTVMDTESPETKHLVQMRTPPMSKTAAAAWDAIRASGTEKIPESFAPRSMSEDYAAFEIFS
jgi:hypothetical protein